MRDVNNPGIKPGMTLGGFRVDKATELKRMNAFYYFLTHPATGARHIHISTSDRENTFSVAFKTVPKDSTGVAHILEHTVLCGSQKYPVKDPFFSMLKRSLNSFMNAFTASDWTMYPFSTQIRKDFYNLMDVYLDAAFFPLLDEYSFMQEGHRFELDPDETGQDRRLVYKGVVYNEMKGAMSSPSQILGRSLLEALYPDTPYGFNSGGDPGEIPNLTHQDLKNFHQRHYHPSNAFFYTYGNLALQDHLAAIEEKVLSRFERIDPKTDVPGQPRWKAPREVVYPYPLSPSEPAEKKSQACVAWLCSDVRNSRDLLVLHLLEHILLGDSGSPLRNALMESGLGSALSDGTGFDPDNLDTLFACGLKDVSKQAPAQVRDLVLDTLKTLADKGIDPERVESAIHQTEFARKEITNTPYPYGLRLLLHLGATCFHGGDPVRVLNFEDDLDFIREKNAGGGFFEEQIQRFFLDNPHQVLLTLKPDPTLDESREKKLRQKLDAIQTSLTSGDLETIDENARILEKRQEGPENVSCLPTLQRKDIPPEVETIAPSRQYPELAGRCYDQPTSGIIYVRAVAGVEKLMPELLPMVPFFCHAFTKMGTKKRDYIQMAGRISRYTGGVGLSAQARTRFSTGQTLPHITLGGKCLDRNQDRLWDILSELTAQFDFSDTQRIRQLLLEFKAGRESAIVGSGHQLAISRAASTFSPTTALGEMWNGISQINKLKKTALDLSEQTLKQISKDLERIAGALFQKSNLKMAVVGEKADLEQAKAAMAGFLENQADEPASPSPLDRFSMDLPQTPPHEGWYTSSSVSFVARAFKSASMKDPEAPALAVAAKMLRSLYLHREIREKGGAYGGFAAYNPETGLFALGSYRDPHITRTLSVYESAFSFIRSDKFSDTDIDEAVLQVCADIDKPDPPGPAALKAFARSLVDLDDDTRRAFKAAVLGMDKTKIHAAAEKYLNPENIKSGVAVISGQAQLEAANLEMKDHPLKIRAI